MFWNRILEKMKVELILSQQVRGVYVEGQAGGGGGGAYTPNYWACSGGAPVTSSTTSNTAVGGYGGLGGTITAIHRVYDGDYVSWEGYSDGPANGGGGAPYLLNIFPMSTSTSHPSPGTYTGPSGDNGFMVQCNIRNSYGTSKSQLWAGGGRGGPGATITLNSTCIQSSLVGFNVTSGANGGYAANGQSYNQIVAGSGSQSVVQGDGDLARGTPGTGNATGGSAQNIGQVKIKLYTPRKY